MVRGHGEVSYELENTGASRGAGGHDTNLVP